MVDQTGVDRRRCRGAGYRERRPGAAAVRTRAWASETGRKGEGDKPEVGPTEDLMREHDVLDRILLIYEESIRRLHGSGAPFQADVLVNAANIVRSGIYELGQFTPGT
jgi:hypothetical protein